MTENLIYWPFSKRDDPVLVFFYLHISFYRMSTLKAYKNVTELETLILEHILKYKYLTYILLVHKS